MKKSACDQVVEYIQDKIRLGEWTSGGKISTESQLQKDTGFGKATIREAVEKLVAMDILTKRQGDGTYVNDITAGSLFYQLIPGFVLNLYDSITILEFREVIEPACVQMFVNNFNEGIIKQLEDYLKCMDLHQNNTERDDFYKADRDFHLAIAKGSNNTIMIKIMEILNGAMTGYHYTANKTIGSKTGVEEHTAILKAIQVKDVELASLLMKRHIQRSKKDLLEYIGNNSE